jgi:hypothetical protein
MMFQDCTGVDTGSVMAIKGESEGMRSPVAVPPTRSTVRFAETILQKGLRPRSATLAQQKLDRRGIFPNKQLSHENGSGLVASPAVRGQIASRLDCLFLFGLEHGALTMCFQVAQPVNILTS